MEEEKKDPADEMLMNRDYFSFRKEEEEDSDPSFLEPENTELEQFFSQMKRFFESLQKSMYSERKTYYLAMKEFDIKLRKINFALTGIDWLLYSVDNYSDDNLLVLHKKGSEWIRIYRKGTTEPIDCFRDFLQFEVHLTEDLKSEYFLAFYGMDCSFFIPIDEIERIERIYITISEGCDSNIEKEEIWFNELSKQK